MPLQELAARAAWAADADRDRAGERLARLEGDRDLAAALQEAGFVGRDYGLFAGEIARYGLAVLTAWIYRGEIFAKVKAKGFGALEPEPYHGALIEDAQSLADETVTLALRAFRDRVLVPGKWDPSKGASLRTFFIGQCLLQFANVYRRWVREVRRSYTAAMELDAFEDIETPQDREPGHQAALKDELRRVLGRITDIRARDAFYLQAIGHSQAEIAARLQMTPKAVGSAMARARRQARGEGNVA